MAKPVLTPQQLSDLRKSVATIRGVSLPAMDKAELAGIDVSEDRAAAMLAVERGEALLAQYGSASGQQY